MKLQAIELDGFGNLSELKLPEIGTGVNVIYGSNGSGKTTLLQFVRGILCGFRAPRQIGLLPPADGRVGGGSLQVRWDGDVCRFSRTDEPGTADQLRVMLVRNDLETAHPRFERQQLRADLVPLLYTVGAADVHSLDDLVRQAVQDGIQLVGSRPEPRRFQTAARHIHAERSGLLHNAEAGLIAELTRQRGQLQSERDQLIEQLRSSCQNLNLTRPRNLRTDVLRAHRQVSWLRNELAAAESDLREAEDQAWQARPTPRVIDRTPPRRATMSLSHLKPPRHDHLDVQRVQQLRRLDRRIELARTLLAETARELLEINLQSARIAGSDDTATGPFLKQLRESLTSLEVGVLELRDESRQLTDLRDANRCACEQWQKSAHEAVGELSRQLYRMCTEVSRFELRHQKSVLAAARTTLHQAEQALLTQLETLRARRQAVLEHSGRLRGWSGTAQSDAEHQHCECLEHDRRAGWTVPHRPPARAVAPSVPAKPVNHPVITRPSREELQQLSSRVEQLHEELARAVLYWREARSRRMPTDLPADIRQLETRLDQLHQDLSSVETQLAACQQRWRVLSVAGEVIRRVIEQLERDRQPTVIQWASQYLRHLTGGQHVEVIVASDDHALEVVAADGSRLPRTALSRGTLDQLALSLRLALVRAYAARGIRLPLILDDVLVDTDRERLRAAVTLLKAFSENYSQQIVYLTCQSHLAHLFHQQGLAVRTLPGSAAWTPTANDEGVRSSEPIQGWVDRLRKGEVHPAEPVTVERPAVATQEASLPARGRRMHHNTRRLLKPLHRRQPDGPYWLSIDAPVDLVPSIGSQMGRRLVGLGVQTVGDLIDLDLEQISMRLASLQITPERLSGWRAEALLLCCVPDLTGSDAQLLVHLGVGDLEQLAQARTSELVRAIDGLSAAERTRIGFATAPTRETVQRWIHNGRRARRLGDARRFSRGRGRSLVGQRTGVGRRGLGRRARATGPRPNAPAVRRRQPAAPSQQEATVLRTPFVADDSGAQHPNPPRQWRFYLSPESPVVDAPSIGPTTANRLSRIGVITVADLLHRSAAEIATRLKNRRVKEETVVLWQQQARLMCRIPLLRGHDAQVLIACDITEPEQVASMSAEALFAIIGPFVATIEGQRLLRSSKTPDLEEVSDWITWARNSRTLRAA